MASNAQSAIAEITSPTHSIPVSIPARRGEPSLCDLPAEIRLEIYNHVLNLSSIPRSYGYTAPLRRPTTPKPLRKHGMLLVSKEFSAEYRQAFYERTTFFLRVDRKNAFDAVPELQRNQTLATTEAGARLSNFWGTPDALLANLRHCTIYIELGDIASSPESVHSVSRIVRANSDRVSANQVRAEMKTYGSLEEFKAHDAHFESALRSAFDFLLQYMQQQRTVQLIWDTHVETARGTRFSRVLNTNWSWDAFGKPFVERLKTKPNLRSFLVKVGDRYGDEIYRGNRGEGGKWENQKSEL